MSANTPVRFQLEQHQVAVQVTQPAQETGVTERDQVYP